MQSFKYGKLAFLVVLLGIQMAFAVTLTVSKDGTGQYSSIQKAIDEADAGDEIVILDTETYEEQVTIDSSLDGLTLRSQNPTSSAKPVIEFQDRINVGPRDADEALIEEMINFDRNGALQVLGALNVTIDGIAVDGGGVYPFGNNSVWEARYALQHGNAAITLWVAGNTVVQNCDLRNAYFGINIKDRNEGGVFANPNPADIDTASIVPFSGFARTGNHLIQYNRIHDNSFGMFFESTWDMGTTVRYNLIYECHHPSGMSSDIQDLTSEGGNQPGGAFMFKDHMLSPVAIYNNTFWHNALIFIGNWKTAPIHLIFNNIYAEPFAYWGTEAVFGAHMECSALYENRMHNCVYAAQQQEPQPNYVTITNDLKPVQTAGGYDEGALITPFPTSANVRWVETDFMSTDPDDPTFLEPNWASAMVRDYIVDQGWEESGVTDPDGSPADLGAIPEGGGRPSDIITIRPTKPIMINGTEANIAFEVTPRKGTMDNIEVTMFGIVITEYDTNTAGDIFGANGDPVSANKIRKLELGSYKVKLGTNETKIQIPAGIGDFAFLELIVSGVGSDGLPFTSAVGFLPYRKLDYFFKVTIIDSNGKPTLEVQAGEAVVLRVEALRSNGTPFTKTVDPTSVALQSPFFLLTPDTSDTVDEIPGGVKNGVANVDVMFTRVPPNKGQEFVAVAGSWIDGDKVVPFLGSSDGITVHPGPAEQVVFQDPPSGGIHVQDPGTSFRAKVQAYDHWGNEVEEPTQVKCISTEPEIGEVVGDTITTTDENGLARFTTRVTGGGLNDTFPLVATLMQDPFDVDTGYMVVGKPRDRLWIFYSDTAAYDSTVKIEGCSGEKVPVTIRASKDGIVINTDRVTAFDIDLPPTLAAYADETSTTKITSSQLVGGEVVIWIQAVAKNVTNGTISAVSADPAVVTGERAGINFVSCYKTINHAAYFADNGQGSVNRVEIYYDSALTETEVPDSIRLFWPDASSGMYMAKGEEIIPDPNDGTHLTVNLTTPFAGGITRFKVSNADLGMTFWNNPLTPDAPMHQQLFAISDSVGPLLANATLIEKMSVGNDTLIITFTEDVGLDVITGKALLLKKETGEDTLNIISAGLHSDGRSIVVEVSGDAGIAEGDSLRINPIGKIVDANKNHAHLLNRPVVIVLSKVAPSIQTAIYQDLNGDGVVDNVKITFNKIVDYSKMFIKITFDGIDALKTADSTFYTVDQDPTLTNTINLAIDNLLYNPNAIQNKTSESMLLTATFTDYIENNTSQQPAQDGAAPVLVALEYHYGKYTQNGEKAKDTIVARYSESLKAIPTVAQPFNFIDVNGSPYTATVSNPEYNGSSYSFIVGSIEPNTVIPFGPNVGTKSDEPGDSAWINTAKTPELNAVDVFDNIQLVDENHHVPVQIQRPPFELDVKVGPNPVNPDVAAAPSAPQNDKMSVRVKAVGDIAVNTNFVVDMVIYDKVGNVVKKIPEDDFKSYTAGHLKGNKVVQDDSCVVYWDATNRNGRKVGNGTYLGVLRVVYTTEGVAPISNIKNLMLGVKNE